MSGYDMKALIDSDYFAYAHGNAQDDEGHPLAWPLVASRISQQLENIVKQSGASESQLFLTGDGNFRDNVATIRTYKGNRPTDKPFHYERVREYLLKFRNAVLIEAMEADDAVSIEQMKTWSEMIDSEGRTVFDTDTIICSIDKDLDNTPGWHYNWIKDEKYWIDETTALQNFYCQCLTGDTVDNIPGLFGVGKQSKLLHRIRSYGDEQSMYDAVATQYEKRFGSYWKQFLTENAVLLWMLREEVKPEKEYLVHWKEWIEIERPEKQVERRLKCLEEQRQKACTNGSSVKQNGIETV